MAHRRQAKLFREQAAHGRVARPRCDPVHVALVDNFYKRLELLSLEPGEASRFDSKIVVGTNARVNNLKGAVMAKLENL